MSVRIHRAKIRVAIAIASSFIALGALTSGCSGASAGLGTSSSACFSALPASFGAVGHNAKLLGVRLIPTAKVRRFISGLPATRTSSLCVLAFQLPDSNGKFVEKRAFNRVQGNFELAIYSLQSKTLIGTRLRNTLPIRFAHAFSII